MRNTLLSTIGSLLILLTPNLDFTLLEIGACFFVNFCCGFDILQILEISNNIITST